MTLQHLTDPRFSPEAKEELLKSYGLDKPLFQQFLLYVKQMLSFRFDFPFISKTCLAELAERLPIRWRCFCLPFPLCLIGYLSGVMAAKGRKFSEKIVLMSVQYRFPFHPSSYNWSSYCSSPMSFPLSLRVAPPSLHPSVSGTSLETRYGIWPYRSFLWC